MVDALDLVYLQGVPDVGRTILARVAHNKVAQFCCTSITSRAFGGLSSAEIMALNPHVHFSARQQRGYGLVNLTPERLQVQMRVIDDVFKEWPSVGTAAAFEVAQGHSRMRRLR